MAWSLPSSSATYCLTMRHLHSLADALRAKLVNPADEHGDGVEGVDLVKVGTLVFYIIPLVVDIRLRGIQVDRSRLEQCAVSPRRAQKAIGGRTSATNSKHQTSTSPRRSNSCRLSRGLAWTSQTPARKPCPRSTTR